MYLLKISLTRMKSYTVFSQIWKLAQDNKLNLFLSESVFLMQHYHRVSFFYAECLKITIKTVIFHWISHNYFVYLLEKFLDFEYFPVNHIQIWAVSEIDVIVARKFAYGNKGTTECVC